ncbi:MAG: hypothetical protein AAFP84_11210 [Actinomycetota bacterium]
MTQTTVTTDSTTTTNETGASRSAARPRTGRLALLLVSATILLAGCGLSLGSGGSNSGPEQPTFEFEIPAGSADLIEQGQPLDILPATLETKIGETIQIINHDDEPHFVGPWFLGPRETLRQRFVIEGIFEGTCSVHPSGEFTVIVAPADA